MGEMDFRVQRLGAADAVVARRAAALLKGGAVSVEYMGRVLQDPATVFLTAFRGDEPIGFLFGYELPRFDCEKPMMCLYEIGVAEHEREKGVGKALIADFLAVCESVHCMKAWVLTNRSNAAAMALYRSCGGADSDEGDIVCFNWNMGASA